MKVNICGAIRGLQERARGRRWGKSRELADRGLRKELGVMRLRLMERVQESSRSELAKELAKELEAELTKIARDLWRERSRSQTCGKSSRKGKSSQLRLHGFCY